MATQAEQISASLFIGIATSDQTQFGEGELTYDQIVWIGEWLAKDGFKR